MYKKFIKNIELNMEKCLKIFEKSINSIRTNRVSTSLLDNIKVEYYGVQTCIKDLSSITIEKSNTIKIVVFENSMVNMIKKSISDSKLEVYPIVNKNIIKIVIPALTEDRRKNIFRIVKIDSEKSRISIRNIRRDAYNALKNYVKSKVFSSDIEFILKKKIQELTDFYINNINNILSKKENEIMKF